MWGPAKKNHLGVGGGVATTPIAQVRARVNPHPDRGGGWCNPPRFFADSEKTAPPCFKLP